MNKKQKEIIKELNTRCEDLQKTRGLGRAEAHYWATKYMASTKRYPTSEIVAALKAEREATQ